MGMAIAYSFDGSGFNFGGSDFNITLVWAASTLSQAGNSVRGREAITLLKEIMLCI